jgi:hypothetical protein
MLVRLVLTRRLLWVMVADFLILMGLSAVLYCAWYALVAGGVAPGTAALPEP